MPLPLASCHLPLAFRWNLFPHPSPQYFHVNRPDPECWMVDKLSAVKQTQPISPLMAIELDKAGRSGLEGIGNGLGVEVEVEVEGVNSGSRVDRGQR